MNDTDRYVKSVLSKQFGLWLAVFVPAFTLSVVALGALELGTLWIFTAGIAFGELSNRAVSWFTEWWSVEREVNQHV